MNRLLCQQIGNEGNSKQSLAETWWRWAPAY